MACRVSFYSIALARVFFPPSLTNNGSMMSGREPHDTSTAAARSLEARVWNLVEKKQIKQAIAECEQLNRQHALFAPGWHTASRLAMMLNNWPLANVAIDRALAIEPDGSPWLLQKALCVARLGDVHQLQGLVDRLSGLQLKTAYQYSTLAMLMTQLGMREEAVQRYEKAAALKPTEAKHYYNIACLQRSLGKIETAERNFDKAISLDATDYEAYKIRSELRTQSPDDNHVASLEQLLQDGIADPRGKANICYALAKELEDLGDAERSFGYLKMGADTRRSHMQYDLQRDLDTMTSIRQAFDAALFNDAAEGYDSAEPIFILGMPRTGTTLVERMLSSHSDVFAAGELTNFAAQMMRMIRAQALEQKPARDEVVNMSTRLDFRALGEAYVHSTRPFTGHTKRFIDKLPLNFLYIGLIHLALPNAKIIHLKRHPLDTCYAIYKQLFIDAYPFSYKLEELGRYYVAYQQLMNHWHKVLSGVIHTVGYENLVGDFATESRRIVEFCELDWQPQCLRFYENAEPSTTASTTQVRQPVYSSSVGKWRQYRENLEPLIKVIEQANGDREMGTFLI